MTITGRITNFETGDPLEGANVFIAGSKIGSAASNRGIYRIVFSVNSTRAKEIELRVEYIGYSPVSFTLPIKTGPVLMDFQMTAGVIKLREVVATPASSPKMTRKEKSKGYASDIITAEELSNMGGNSWVGALRAKIAGLTVIQTRGGGIGETMLPLLRRQRSGPIRIEDLPLIVLDGIPLSYIMLDGVPSMAYIAITDIEKIEVVKGPFLIGRYGRQAQSGAILITTKRAP